MEYVKDGQTCKEYGPVILATGGYAADFTEDPLLKKYRPDIYNLPTTNGELYSLMSGMQEQVIPGLFASGEIAGGVHGANSVHLEITWGSHTDATSQYTPPVQAPQALPSQTPASEKNLMNQHSDCWVIVNGEVLNVTNFLPDHPGFKKPF
ncbi:hypothetical protein C2G38_2144798 [Gigaspora rosea]|uniref:Cytochrome b5 heme-binding domain-containing protein n=1 Tax=Gigaspora rosea TaxID=44941 RepID=A0A397V0V5_9GLOM|nr:hypothetical protein C2G38_2144798 [Gigaspora rosea]